MPSLTGWPGPPPSAPSEYSGNIDPPLLSIHTYIIIFRTPFTPPRSRAYNLPVGTQEDAMTPQQLTLAKRIVSEHVNFGVTETATKEKLKAIGLSDAEIKRALR